jgi:hypothetical protein
LRTTNERKELRKKAREARLPKSTLPVHVFSMTWSETHLEGERTDEGTGEQEDRANTTEILEIVV